MLRMLGLGAALLLGGCAAAPLPTYGPVDTPAALDIIARRQEPGRTVFSGAGITITDPGGSSVRLDGALAAEFPDRIRLRAWKFNTAVFDVTAVGDDVWVLASERLSTDQTESIPARGILTARRLLGSSFFQSAHEAAGSTDAVLVVEGPLDEAGGIATCEIDRLTLTPRRYRAGDATLVLDRYKVVSGVPWAGRWQLTSPRGTVTVRLQNPVLEADLAPGAFTPPRRAVKVTP